MQRGEKNWSLKDKVIHLFHVNTQMFYFLRFLFFIQYNVTLILYISTLYISLYYIYRLTISHFNKKKTQFEHECVPLVNIFTREEGRKQGGKRSLKYWFKYPEVWEFGTRILHLHFSRHLYSSYET